MKSITYKFVTLLLASLFILSCDEEKEPGFIESDNPIFLDVVSGSDLSPCLTDMELVSAGEYVYVDAGDGGSSGTMGESGNEYGNNNTAQTGGADNYNNSNPNSISVNEDMNMPRTSAERVMIAMDFSGSMAASAAEDTKLMQAKEAVTSFIEGLDQSVDVGLLAFGHKGDNTKDEKSSSCSGVEVLFPVSKPNRDQISQKIDNLKPTGWTPLADAIEKAANEMNPQGNMGEQVIWVISDGKESCGGDPVAVAQRLHDGPSHLTLNIIGVDLENEVAKGLDSVSRAGGGQFVNIESSESPDISSAIAGTLSVSVDPILVEGYQNEADAVDGIGQCLEMTMMAEKEALEIAQPLAATPEEYEEAKELLEERHEVIRQLLEEYSESILEGELEETVEVVREMKAVLGMN